MPDTPMTEAGKALLAELNGEYGHWADETVARAAILAIEAEARAETLRRVEALRRYFESYGVHGLTGTCLREHATGEWVRYIDLAAAIRDGVPE